MAPRKSANAMKIEVWRSIPPIPAYEASSEGRIRSLDRRLPMLSRWGTACERFYAGRILRLKPKPNGWGGYYYCFYTDGNVYWQVNRAVCWAFHGAPPTSVHEAAHLNGVSTDDRLSNLKWVTPAENAAHKAGHGTDSAGDKNASAVLREECIPAIIIAYSEGAKSADLAVKYGVSTGAIIAVIGGRSWAHVKSDYRKAAKIQAAINIYEAPRCAK